MASPPPADAESDPAASRLRARPTPRSTPTVDDWQELERRAAEARRTSRYLRNRSVELRSVAKERRPVTWDGLWLKP
jgi:hypothetical protein